MGKNTGKIENGGDAVIQRTKINMNGNIVIEDKIKASIERIKNYEPEEGYYVAYSGGKDSDVILNLVKKAGVKFDSHYQLTTVDPPELVNHIRNKHPEVEIDISEETMWQLIPKKRMPPTRIVRYCCEVLKERGGIGRKVITGIRWAESNKRAKRNMVETCYKDKTKVYLHPIIDWTKKDVWDYIKQENIDYCKLYDEGFDRLGCIGCPYQNTKGMKRDFKKWPKYKQAYIRSFQKMVDKRIKDGLKTNWKTGEEVMDWWISNSTEKVAEGQTMLMNDN